MTANSGRDDNISALQAALKNSTSTGTTKTSASASTSGVVLGPDGKPCRSCTSVRDWMRMVNSSSSSSSKSNIKSATIPDDCPPDVEQLGRSTWTLLHTMAATYPTTPSQAQKSDMASFISILSRSYPCWTCAADFREWMATEGNQPRVGGRSELGLWLCRAHNEVNVKLGKKVFDCDRWEERWKDGWKDGRCG